MSHTLNYRGTVNGVSLSDYKSLLDGLDGSTYDEWRCDYHANSGRLEVHVDVSGVATADIEDEISALDTALTALNIDLPPAADTADATPE